MKKIILILIVFLPLKVFALEISELDSNKFIIYDLTTKEVLAESFAYEKTSIASLTKIMTTITAIEKINNLEDRVIVTSQMLNSVYWNASRAGLKVGDTLTYEDLLYATILPSGADAAHALAISISGNISNFIVEMNNLAKKIGLENTNFANVSGIDNINNYSTLYDISKLLEYSLKNDTFKKIYTTKEYILTNGLKVDATIIGFNKRMNLDIGRILGSKTGYTSDAGYCLSSLIFSNNHDIIIITGGAKKQENNYYHVIDTLNLIDYTDRFMEEKEEQIRLEQESIARIEKQEKIRKEKLIRIENNQIYVNKTLIIGSVFIFTLLIILISNKKKRKKKK